MSATFDIPTTTRKRRRSTAAFIVPPFLFLATMIMAADFTAIHIAPLRKLQIDYPLFLDYAHFIIPGACAAAWLASVFKWPRASSIVCVLVCFSFIPQIRLYAEGRTERVPVHRWLDQSEAKAFESKLGFPIFQMGDRDGFYVVVAREHALKTKIELSQLNLFRVAATVNRRTL